MQRKKATLKHFNKASQGLKRIPKCRYTPAPSRHSLRHLYQTTSDSSAPFLPLQSHTPNDVSQPQQNAAKQRPRGAATCFPFLFSPPILSYTYITYRYIQASAPAAAVRTHTSCTHVCISIYVHRDARAERCALQQSGQYKRKHRPVCSARVCREAGMWNVVV